MAKSAVAGTRVVIIGAGLAGLTAATLLARAGARVHVMERAPQVGGRALTLVKNGFYLNLGPHALYKKGQAARVLARLGIEPQGRTPSLSGLAWHEGRLHALPTGVGSLLKTSLLSLREKLEAMRVLGRMMSADPSGFSALSLEEWLEQQARSPKVRQLVRAHIRLSTYAAPSQYLSAGAAIAQFQLGAGGVRYLDGGWQSLVTALLTSAELAGVRVETGIKVERIRHGASVETVQLADGRMVEADAVILATGPAAAVKLLSGAPQETVQGWAEALRPVTAACLDLGLARLPRPDAKFALGIDQPVYYSVHSASARLAPEGGAVLHVARYLDPDSPQEVASAERSLEEMMDVLQPGWREHVVVRRYLPHMVVSNALPEAARGGLGGRPEPQVPGVSGLYVAGDWVGPRGMLADAALASAETAAEAICRQAERLRGAKATV